MRMATGTHLKNVLAPLLQLHPATFDRHLGNLAAAGLLRRSGLGGGKAAVHLSSVEYANILLGLATPFPSTGGAEAAKALGRLSPEKLRAGDTTLLTSLASTIELMALQIRRGEQATGDDDWELTLCLNPLMAAMSWPQQAPGVVRRYFDYVDGTTIAPATEPVPLIRRQTVLTTPLLMTAARLLYDNGTAEAPGRTPAAEADESLSAHTEEPESPNSCGSTACAA